LKQDVEVDDFIEEAVVALSAACKRIVDKVTELRARVCGGPELHILLAFPSVPLPLREGYMQRYESEGPDAVYDIIPHAERCELWSRFCDRATSRITIAHPDVVRVVDVRDDFTARGFAHFTDPAHEDHHPLLNRTQHAVATQVRALSWPSPSGTTEFKLEPREWPHDYMYAHVRRRFTPSAPAPSGAGAAPAAPPPPPALLIPTCDPMKPKPKESWRSRALSPAINAINGQRLTPSSAKRRHADDDCKPWLTPRLTVHTIMG